MQSRPFSSRFVRAINPVVVVVFLAAIFAGIVPVASAQTPAPSEVLLNGSFEGLADRANGFAAFYPGAAVTATAADGAQAMDLGRPATSQEWAALGAVAAYAPPGLRFGAVDGLTFQYQVPADIAAAPTVRLQTWFSLDLDGDGVRDECIIHTEPTALAQTTGWVTLTIGADTTHYAGGAPCNASAATAPLATFQVAYGAATVLSVTIQTALSGGLLDWPAGLPLLVDAVSVQTQQPTPLAAPTVSASVCGGGIRFARIQHAIDCAPAGATVYVPVGTYPENLRIDTNLLGASLDGLLVCRSDDAATTCTAGDVLPIIAAAGGAPALDVLADDVTVQGLALGGADPVVRASDADGFTLQATRVDMGPFNAGASSGIQLVRAHQASIVDNTVQFPANTAGTGGTGVAVQVLGSDDTELRGNQIIGDLHPGATAVRIVPVFGETDGGTGHVVADNVIVGTHSGVRADATSDLTVSGNTITDNGIGIDLIDVQGALVTGNALTGSETDQLPPDFLGYGVFVRQASTDYTIVGNDISGYHTGVYVGGSANGPGVVSDNHIHGNRASGLLLEGTRPNDPMTVERNTFADNQQAVHLDTNRPLRLRENSFNGGLFALTTNPDPARFPTLEVDARLNHWGVDSWRHLEERVAAQDTQTVLQVPFLTATGHVEPQLPRAVPASHSTTPATCDAHPDAEFIGGQCRFFTIQAALDFAHAGGRVVVPMSASAVDPVPHFGPLAIGTNNIGEALDLLTLCGSVVVFECAPVNEPARFALSTGTSWGVPPSVHQGQAIRMTGAGSSTSLFTRDFQGQGAPQVGDLTGLGFDFMRESGACSSLRITLRVDTDGDGVVDVPYQVYPHSTFTCPAIGQWVHVDLLQSDRWGGATGTTQADAHAALGPAHRVLSLNLIVDGGAATSVFWADNQRYQDSFFSEPADACNDPEDPTCVRETARDRVIIDGAGSSAPTLTIAAANVLVTNTTLTQTGAPAGAQRIVVDLGAAPLPFLIGNRIEFESTGCAASGDVGCWLRDGEQYFAIRSAGAYSPNIAENLIRSIPGTDGGLGGMAVRGPADGGSIRDNIILGMSDGTNLFGSGIVVQNNLFVGGFDQLPLCPGAGAPTTVRSNAFVGSNEAIIIQGGCNTGNVEISQNSLGLTNAFGLGVNPAGNAGTVLAECNDWGVYTGDAIPARIRDQRATGLDVDYAPWVAPLTGGLSGCLPPLDADFGVSYDGVMGQSTGTVHGEFQFFDTTASHKAVVSRMWDFGDGETSVLPSPTHQYTAPGVYTVTLMVRDLDGAVDVEQKVGFITVTSCSTLGGADQVQVIGGGLFCSIQDAVDAAAAGDTVLVAPDTYLEQVTVPAGKAGLTICSALLGAPGCDAQTDTTIVQSASGIGFLVQSAGVTIQGLTIEVAGVSPTYGIEVPLGAPQGGLVVRDNIIRSAPSADGVAGENGVRGRLQGAIVADNVFEGWAGAVFLRPYGADNRVEGNTIRLSNVGVLTWSPSTRITANVFDMVTTAVDIAHIVTDPQSVATDNVLRENRFGGAANGVRVRGDGYVVDARLNEWGVDEWRLLDAKVRHEGTDIQVLQLPFLRSDGGAEPPLAAAAPASHSAVAATCDAHPDAEFVGGACRFLTVQAAIDFSHAGGHVYIPMSETLDPTPRFETLDIEQNNVAESLDGLTVCATVALHVCAPVNEPARFALSTNSAWGAPPVVHQGQAVRIAGTGSTSLFTRTFDGTGAPQVGDLFGLGFDVLVESGPCPAGDPRVTLRVDTDNDATADTNYQVYPPASFFPCTIGEWAHVDLLQSTNWGGRPGTTQAGAHAALGPDHRVLSMNLIWDGAPGAVAWFDNQRYQDAFFREPADACDGDARSPLCAREEARPTTIVDGTGGADIVRIGADDVTVSGLTIRQTGAPVAPVTGVRLDGVVDPVVADNRILLEGGGCTPQQIVSGVCYDPFPVNGVAGTSQGAVLSGNEIVADLVSATGDGSIGGTDGVVGDHAGVLITMNTLRGWAANAVYLWGPDAVVESNNFRLNAAHVLLCGGADNAEVRMNEMLLGFEAVAFCGATAPADVRVNNNQLGLTNGMGAVVRAGTGPVAADLTCNDWGVYNGVAIRETRIREDNAAANTLQPEPFTSPDGLGGLGCLLAPVADFTASTFMPVRDEVVTFQDVSAPGSKPLVLREWDFGDGTTDVRPEVEHSYPAPGVYDVTLRVQDADGMTATVIKQINVENLLPQITIAGGPTIGELETLGLAVYAPDPDADDVSIVASGVPAGAIFQDHGSGFASMSWTPPAGSAGDYTVTFTATDSLGGMISDSITITVLDTLGPVDFIDVRDLVLVEGYAVPTTVRAVDDTGDPVTLSASGLPAWATFADVGNGRGEFAWAPPLGTAPTTFVVSLTATAGADTALRTFSVEVVPRADIELLPVGPSIVAGSPDDAVPLQVEVRNVGLSDATVELVASAEAGWATSVVASVFVPALSSVVVSFSATPEFGDATSRVHLSASAVGFPGETESLYWRINVPVLPSVTFVPAPSTTGGVIGEVTAVYLNGAPAVGLAVRMEQRPPLNVGNLLATSVSGSADGNGTFAFDFGVDPSSRLPGEHGFTATVTYGSRQYLAAGTFEVIVA